MLNDLNQEPMTPLTDEEFAAIRKTIQAEAMKLIADYKSRGFMPGHLIAVAGVLLATLLPNPTLDQLMISITAACVRAIGESDRKKARKLTIN